MKAVVMAGGEGSRLRPLTSSQPKPMVPIVGKPCIEHVLELLRRHGMREVIVTLAFMPQSIRTYFGDGDALDMELDYSVEEVPLGTAGSVRLAGERLDDTFLVISGDAVCDVDLGALVEAHRASGAGVTLGLKAVADPLEYGIVVTGEEGRVERFHEKPSWGQVFTDTINTGIYVVEPEVLATVPAGHPFDFSHDLFPLLLETGVPLHGHVLDGYWHDIGTLEELRKANFDALDGRVQLEITGLRLPGNVWVAEDAALRDLEPVEGPAFVGPNCRIADPDSIGPYTVLSGGAVLGSGTRVSHSVLGARVHLGRGALVEGAIIGNDCDIGDHARIHEDVTVGDQVAIGAEATVFPGVRVYPYKRIDPGSQIHDSVVWESRGTASIFGRDGAVGRVDVELTPELAVRIAAALGSALPAGTRVVASRDASDACRMIERAIIAGLSSTGLDVADLRVSPSAVTRHVLKTQALAAGVHVGRSGSDPERVQVRVFEPPGIQMGDGLRKLVERQFSRQELRRVPAADVGTTTYPARVRESYAQDLLDGIDAERIRRRAFRVAIDFGHSAASFTLPLVLGPLGVDAIGLHGFLADAPVLPELRGDDVRRIVTAVGADLGVVLDRSAERLLLVDERGEEVPPDLGLLLVVSLLGLAGRRGAVAVPVTATALVDAVAARGGLEVRRTGHSLAALTAAATDEGVLCAGAPTGGFVFPDVVAGYDAVGALCKLLELLAIVDRPPSAVVAELPRPTLVTETAPCPFVHKGAVMRVLGERFANRRLEQVDGVRLHDERGSVHALPDQVEPTIHVFAEGRTRVESVALAREVLAAIEDVVTAAGQGGVHLRRTRGQVST